MNGTAERAARLLAQLAETGATIPDLPEAIRPIKVAEAYAVQDAALEGATPYGWKVGPADAPGSLCAAPLRGAAAYSSPHTLSGPRASTMAIEVEVAVTLGADLPNGASAEQVANSIASVHLAYELFCSCYVDRAKVGFPSLLADHLSNAGIVVGKGEALDRNLRLDNLEIDLLRNGELVERTSSGPALETMLDQLAWLSGHVAERGFPLRSGTVVLTGARIGPVPVSAGALLHANAAIGSVTLAT